MRILEASNSILHIIIHDIHEIYINLAVHRYQKITTYGNSVLGSQHNKSSQSGWRPWRLYALAFLYMQYDISYTIQYTTQLYHQVIITTGKGMNKLGGFMKKKKQKLNNRTLFTSNKGHVTSDWLPPLYQLTSYPLGQNGRYFANDIFICIFVNESFIFWLKFHLSLFLRVRLTITQYWFR